MTGVSARQVWTILPRVEIKNNKIRKKENTFNKRRKTEFRMHGAGNVRIH